MKGGLSICLLVMPWACGNSPPPGPALQPSAHPPAARPTATMPTAVATAATADVPQPSEDDLLDIAAPHLSGMCKATHRRAAQQKAVKSCLGGPAVELPLTSIETVVDEHCTHDAACKKRLHARFALPGKDRACWRSGGKRDGTELLFGEVSDFDCWCHDVFALDQRLFMHCRRQRFDDDAVTDLIVYHHDQGTWKLALDVVAIRLDLDAPRTVAARPWRVGDELVLIAAGCLAPLASHAIAETCATTGRYRFDATSGRFVRAANLPRCARALVPPPHAAVRPVPLTEGSAPWYIYEATPLEAPSWDGPEVPCPGVAP